MSDRIPLSTPVLAGNEWAYVRECLDSAWVSSAGPFVDRFERDIAALTGSPHAIACVNGTAALHVALLPAGVVPGDLVAVPAITFIAPINAVRYCGADPVFFGCDEYLDFDAAGLATYLDAECERVDGTVRERSSGRVLRAVVPVHVLGTPCDMAALGEVCERWGLPLIEDATESLGARWTAGPLEGRQPGTVGLMGCLSFNGNKIVTTGGGGMLLTASDDLAERARYLTTQAKDDPVRYIHGDVGYNYRLTNVAAAIGVAQLEQLPGFLASRARNAAIYAERLAAVPGLSLVGVPSSVRANHWLTTLLVDPEASGLDREALMQRLSAAGIESRPIWYPNHLQAPYRDCRSWSVERAVELWDRALSVPSGAGLAPADVEGVCDAIARAVRTP